MPYFTRKPYDEMRRDAQDQALSAKADADAEDFAALAEQVLAEESPGPAADQTFLARAPATPEQAARMVLSLQNPGDAPRDLTLTPGDLTGPQGAMIPAEAIAVDPPRMILPPGEARDVSLLLTLPAEAIAGRYTGPLNLGDQAGQTAPIAFDVVQPDRG